MRNGMTSQTENTFTISIFSLLKHKDKVIISHECNHAIELQYNWNKIIFICFYYK